METEQSSPGDGSGRVVRLGVISDTHGLLRPEVFEIFRGAGLILHAGDVGDPAILGDLETIAPVVAVWGNVDGPELRGRVDEMASGAIAGLRWAMAHGHQVEPAYERLIGRLPEADLIVHGHTHEPSLARVGGGLLLNPGSAGPRRFDKPVSVALVDVDEGGAPSVRHLDVRSGGTLRP